MTKVCPFMTRPIAVAAAGWTTGGWDIAAIPCMENECMAWVDDAPEPFCLRLVGDYRLSLAIKRLLKQQKDKQELIEYVKHYGGHLISPEVLLRELDK